MCDLKETERTTVRSGKRPGYYYCRNCGEDFTVRTRTIFECSHTPLHKWIFVMYLVGNCSQRHFIFSAFKQRLCNAGNGMYMPQRLHESWVLMVTNQEESLRLTKPM